MREEKFNKRKVLRELIEKGILKPDREGKVYFDGKTDVDVFLKGLKTFSELSDGKFIQFLKKE